MVLEVEQVELAFDEGGELSHVAHRDVREGLVFVNAHAHISVHLAFILEYMFVFLGLGSVFARAGLSEPLRLFHLIELVDDGVLQALVSLLDVAPGLDKASVSFLNVV